LKEEEEEEEEEESYQENKDSERHTRIAPTIAAATTTTTAFAHRSPPRSCGKVIFETKCVQLRTTPFTIIQPLQFPPSL